MKRWLICNDDVKNHWREQSPLPKNTKTKLFPFVWQHILVATWFEIPQDLRIWCKHVYARSAKEIGIANGDSWMDKNALISVTVILNAPDIELTLWGEFATPFTLRSKGLVRKLVPSKQAQWPWFILPCHGKPFVVTYHKWNKVSVMG